jgi:SpoVK/Ycf46/Vps4 family AAA+-type ATPase
MSDKKKDIPESIEEAVKKFREALKKARESHLENGGK